MMYSCLVWIVFQITDYWGMNQVSCTKNKLKSILLLQLCIRIASVTLQKEPCVCVVYNYCSKYLALQANKILLLPKCK